MVKANNYKIGKAINEAINNQIYDIDVVETLQPVFIANPNNLPAYVQPSLPIASSKQRILSYGFAFSPGTNTVQVATNTNTTRYYFLSLQIVGNIAADSMHIQDSTTATDVGVTNAITTSLCFAKCLALTTYNYVNPLLTPTTSGIRFTCVTQATSVTQGIIFYIEETLT